MNNCRFCFFSGSGTICSDNAITLNAAVINGGASPYYAWKVNNNALVLPNNNPSLTYTPGTMRQSVVKVIVTSSIAANFAGAYLCRYQWYKDGVLIPGATNQTYAPAENGNYYVVVTTNGCSGTSNRVNVEGLSLNELRLSADDLKLYPNPATNDINVANNSNLRMKSIQVTNVLGQQLKSFEVNEKRFTINVSDLQAGIYQVIISFEEGMVVRTISVIK